MQQKDWLKLKSYPHFLPRIEHKQFIRSYVQDTETVTKHRFFPLIHRTILERRFRRKTEKDENGVYKRTKKRALKIKKREIHYANHLDAHIYAYYAKLLNANLEKIYQKEKELNESVIAYRAIPFNNKRNKCNYDFAKEVFDYIDHYQGEELVVFCFDITRFFDSLDHKYLKASWYQLLDRNNLPIDHYNVYKAITKFSYVDERDIFKAFPELKIKKHRDVRQRNIKAFCESIGQFRERIALKKLIKGNKVKIDDKWKWKDYGIPQGTPLSAALSNVYMLEFDRAMIKIARDFNGFYRRYSDDILFACAPEYAEIIKKRLLQKIDDDLKLEIQDTKTQKVVFQKENNKWKVFTEEEGRVIPNKPLAYLGLEYDGRVVRLRQKGISKYYRGLKRAIRRHAFYAKVAKRKKLKTRNPNIDDWIFRNGLYKRYSHLGAKRKKIDGRVFWGNYYSYVLNANKIMGGNAIKRQLRSHWKIIEREIRKFERLYDLKKCPSNRKANAKH